MDLQDSLSYENILAKFELAYKRYKSRWKRHINQICFELTQILRFYVSFSVSELGSPEQQNTKIIQNSICRKDLN